MANDNDLLIKIVLDDGSVVEGMFKAQQAGEKAAKGIGTAFDQVKDAAGSIAPDLTSKFSSAASNIAAVIKNPLVLISLAATAAAFAIKEAFDLTLEGERLNKIDKTFQSLTNQFGIAGDELKRSFGNSLGGLVSTSDAVQSLNKAIVTLGSRAAQLPQVMDLARKATKLFGGEVTDNFEAMNQAIATGATRQLRGLGIIINAEDVYKRYAKSIHVSAEVLSEAGKQQALLNEVLLKGGQRFAGVTSEGDTATGSYKKFKVAATEALEEITKVVSDALAPAFTAGLKVATGFIKDFTDLIKEPAKGVDALAEKQNLLNKELSGYQEIINRGEDKGLLTFIFGSGVEEFQAKADKVTAELTKIDEGFEAAFLKSARISQIKGGNDNSAESEVDAKKLSDAQRKSALEFTAFILGQDQIRIGSQIEYNNTLIGLNVSGSVKLEAFQANTRLKEKLAQEQFNQAVAVLDEKKRTDEFFTKTQYEDEVAALTETAIQQTISRKKAEAKQLLELEQEKNFETMDGFAKLSAAFSAFSHGAKESAEEFTVNTAKKFSDLGKQALASLGTAVGSAFSKFGAALATGKDAGKAFAESLGESLVQAASMFGDFFIQMGIARAASTYGLDVTAYTMLGAGFALKLMSGMASGAKSASSAGASSSAAPSGGGIASGVGSLPSQNTPADATRADVGAKVQVVVQGSIYDSHETGARIVDLINNAFDQKGVVVQRGAFA